MVGVCEAGVRAPASYDLDCLGVAHVDMEACGAASSEGVARDEIRETSFCQRFVVLTAWLRAAVI
jgi:hypothetical protein